MPFLLQCPVCRGYWNAQARRWEHCEWMSKELLHLCLSQTFQWSEKKGARWSHPHIQAAAQKSTAIYDNLIRIEVTVEYRLCCKKRRLVRHAYEDDADQKRSPERWESQQQFCFSVSHVLCQACRESANAQEPRIKACNYPLFFIRHVCEKLSKFNPILRKRMLQKTHVSKASCFQDIPADCHELILLYLPVRDLNSLSRVNSLWAGLVSKELHHLPRYVEAWNDSTRRGVYVNLDQYLVMPSSGVPGKIASGGYLLPLPARQFEDTGHHTDLEETATSLDAIENGSAFASARWDYTAVTTRQPSASLACPLFIDHLKRTLTLPAVLLQQCLPLRHARLLQVMCERFEVRRRGTPAFFQNKLLMQFVFVEPSPSPTPSFPSPFPSVVVHGVSCTYCFVVSSV